MKNYVSQERAGITLFHPKRIIYGNPYVKKNKVMTNGRENTTIKWVLWGIAP